MIFKLSSPVTFLKAVFRATKYLWDGRPVIASKEIQLERAAICAKCPLYLDGQCTACTCFVSVKVLLSSETCPDNPPKWKRLTFSKPITTTSNVA